MTRPIELDAPYVTTLVRRHDVHPAGFVRHVLELPEAVRDRALTQAAPRGAVGG